MTPLDLRGKTMTELQELDRENDDRLNHAFDDRPISPLRDTKIREILADRRQIREEMERRRDIEALGVPAEKLGPPGNTYANLYGSR